MANVPSLLMTTSVRIRICFCTCVDHPTRGLYAIRQGVRHEKQRAVGCIVVGNASGNRDFAQLDGSSRVGPCNGWIVELVSLLGNLQDKLESHCSSLEPCTEFVTQVVGGCLLGFL